MDAKINLQVEYGMFTLLLAKAMENTWGGP